MDIQIIREFISLANGENISIVADQHFISPSLLSLHIQKLEKELGCALFDRTPRRMFLNENGKLFHFYAKEIVAAFDRYIFEAKKGVDQKNTVSVAMLGSVAQATTENIITSFFEENPDIKLNILSRDYPDVVYHYLATGKCDFALMYCADISRPDITQIPLFEDRIVAAVPQSHRLAGRKVISCKDLRGESILMQNADILVFRKAMAFYESFGVTPNMSFAVNSELLMEELLSYNAGVGLIIKESAKRLTNFNVSVLEIEPVLNLEFSISYRTNDKFTPAQKRFMRFIQDKYRAG